MTKKYFALTKWIGGSDDKKYTVGVPVDWIINFDIDEYQKDNHDPAESYVVEWRDTPKPPKGGWKCYDCHVILVSGILLVWFDFFYAFPKEKFTKFWMI